ncbi:DUF169 domain-containing protein [Clostridium sp.]|uniref:DUF169 domain-containing protein n=1 Tax=Clostridium sp. TaxID=1506 RepID=UPI002FC685C3
MSLIHQAAIHTTNKQNEKGNKYAELPKKLVDALEIKRNIVGVKFLPDKQTFDAAYGKHPYNQMPYCVIVKVAMAKVALKVTIDNLSCRGARNVLGLYHNA